MYIWFLGEYTEIFIVIWTALCNNVTLRSVLGPHRHLPGATPLTPPIHPDINEQALIIFWPKTKSRGNCKSFTQLPTGWQIIWIWIFSCALKGHQTFMTPWSQSYSTYPCSIRSFIVYHMSFRKGLSVTMIDGCACAMLLSISPHLLRNHLDPFGSKLETT